MEVMAPKQRLLIIGGAEDREKDSLILNKFVELAGGSKARVVVVTTATTEPEESKEEYEKVFTRLGVAKMDYVDVAQRADAMEDEAVKAVESATGIFFTGGDQFFITTLMGGTAVQSAIFRAAEEGVIIAGTSAGAAMMGSAMIMRGESEGNPRLESVEIAAGVGLMGCCVIDTHFSQRGRHGRLLTAVAHFPQHMGFGIDENTAMLVDKHGLEVIGEGSVTIYDASTMTYSDVPYVEKGQSIAMGNVVVHVVPNSYKFDFHDKRLVTPKTGTAGPKEIEKKVKAAKVSESSEKA
jgi:cyanophycinase